jgi:dephospho-CoA kinase
MSVPDVSTKPIILGLTGGIASGKSTALAYFKKLNIPVIDSDQIVRNLWESNNDMIQKAESYFGFTIHTIEDRQKLSEIIFKDPIQREALNKIVHPYVFKQIEIEKKLFKTSPVIVIDMPLLYEVSYQKKCDHVLVVYVDLKTQLRRLMRRSHLNKKDALARINTQMPLDDKAKLADVVLDNNKTMSNLKKQIDAYLGGLLT